MASDVDSPWSILIVDDDRVSLSVLKKLLEVEGYEVSTAEDGQEAWELIQKQHFSIVLTDRQMPHMNGMELCEKIRAMETQSYVYIILLTVLKARNEIIEGLNAGADDYLVKPYDYVELIARLRGASRVLSLEKSLRLANDDIAQLSLMDDVTLAYNRRAYDERIDLEFKRASRYGRSLSMVLCDLDNFSSLNESLGGDAGNQVLHQFVERISSVIRSDVDQIYRYSSNAFVLLLPETPPENASILAERIRHLTEALPFELNNKEIVNITASFGTSGYHASGEQDDDVTPQDLFAFADKCLCEARLEGSNCVKSFVIKNSA